MHDTPSQPPVASSPDAPPHQPYQLRFSHNVIEHLGLKLYQNKPTNVLAELVSNAWDADAKHVWLDVRNHNGTPASIVVADDGLGMDDGLLRGSYLIVGKAKRKNEGEPTRNGRSPMGRKGIGKLAPFGVARLVDLLTVHKGLATWLRFVYGDMLPDADNPLGVQSYAPKELARAVPLTAVDASLAGDDAAAVSSFLQRIGSTASGTLVLATDLTLRTPLNDKDVSESMGRRFTVTLLDSDFQVFVNGHLLDESVTFPEWELRIPEEGFATETFSTPQGEREVRHWVGFVKTAEWPQEQAGIGVYAHGKIAQDRPFFFKNEGNEIYSRYMYGVLEADWLDELDHDTVSTDRTSVDWEDPALQPLHAHGRALVKRWLAEYERHKTKKAHDESDALITRVTQENQGLRITPGEKAHLAELLAKVTPRLGRDLDQRTRFVEAAVKAWVHEPARRLVKKLWEQAAKFDAEQFANTVHRLVDELVPESLSLAVVFSQRVYALTRLNDRIANGNETQLQQLIEEFPWILHQGFERFAARKALRTLCEEAEAKDELPTPARRRSSGPAYTKPDFVFFADSQETDILIVELKGPKETASWDEYAQLHSYMTYIQRFRPKATVRGVLLSGSHDPEPHKQYPGIELMTWDTVLLRSRREHMVLLSALLAGSEAHAEDPRVQQICELGGQPVLEFLTQMSEKDPALRELVQQFPPATPYHANEIGAISNGGALAGDSNVSGSDDVGASPTDPDN
jgi:RecB family endonuclease NucS